MEKNKKKFLGFLTHTAPNHPDEVLGRAILVKQGRLDPESQVKMTRDKNEIQSAFEAGYFICDVGDLNDEGRRDHHHDRFLPAASSLVAEEVGLKQGPTVAMALEIISARDCNPGEGLKKFPAGVLDLGEFILLFNGEEYAFKIQCRLAELALESWQAKDGGILWANEFQVEYPEFISTDDLMRSSELPTYLPEIGKYLGTEKQKELQNLMKKGFEILASKMVEYKELLSSAVDKGQGLFLIEKEINLSQALSWGIKPPQGLKYLAMMAQDQPGTFKVTAYKCEVPQWSSDTEGVMFRHPAGFFARVKSLAVFY